MIWSLLVFFFLKDTKCYSYLFVRILLHLYLCFPKFIATVSIADDLETERLSKFYLLVFVPWPFCFLFILVILLRKTRQMAIMCTWLCLFDQVYQLIVIHLLIVITYFNLFFWKPTVYRKVIFSCFSAFEMAAILFINHDWHPWKKVRIIPNNASISGRVINFRLIVKVIAVSLLDFTRILLCRIFLQTGHLKANIFFDQITSILLFKYYLAKLQIYWACYVY